MNTKKEIGINRLSKDSVTIDKSGEFVEIDGVIYKSDSSLQVATYQNSIYDRKRLQEEQPQEVFESILKFWGDEPTKESPKQIFSVEVTALEGGTVEGGGRYEDGIETFVKAIPEPNWKFVKWTIEDKDVSTKLLYSFTVDTDVALTAVFEKEERIEENLKE